MYLKITQASWVRMNLLKSVLLLCAKAACLLEVWLCSIRSNVA